LGQFNKRTVANRGGPWRFEKPWRGTARFVVRFAKKPNRAVAGRFAVRQDANRTVAVRCGPCEPPRFVEPWSTLRILSREDLSITRQTASSRSRTKLSDPERRRIGYSYGAGPLPNTTSRNLLHRAIVGIPDTLGAVYVGTIVTRSTCR